MINGIQSEEINMEALFQGSIREFRRSLQICESLNMSECKMRMKEIILIHYQ